MAVNINKIIVAGNLTKDPTVNETAGGTKVCNFSVACNSTYTDKAGEQKKETEYFNIVTFGKNAENCGKYLVKGSNCFIEGKIKTKTYEVGGQKRTSIEIMADKVTFISRPKKQ